MDLKEAIDIVEGKKTITLNHKELVAVELGLRFLAHNLKRCSLTGMYYLPSNSGMACSGEQATAIEKALTKIMEA